MKHRDEIRLNISTFSSSGERNFIGRNMSPPLAMSFNSDSPKIVFFFGCIVIRVYFKELYTSDETD